MSYSAPEPSRPIISTSVHLEPAEVQQLDELAVRWRVSRSGAVRKLLKAAKEEGVLCEVEAATRPEKLPAAKRYRLLRDVTVPIKMGLGLPSVPTLFTRDRVLERDAFGAAYLEHLHHNGALLDPLD